MIERTRQRLAKLQGTAKTTLPGLFAFRSLLPLSHHSLATTERQFSASSFISTANDKSFRAAAHLGTKSEVSFASDSTRVPAPPASAQAGPAHPEIPILLAVDSSPESKPFAAGAREPQEAAHDEGMVTPPTPLSSTPLPLPPPSPQSDATAESEAAAMPPTFQALMREVSA